MTKGRTDKMGMRTSDCHLYVSGGRGGGMQPSVEAHFHPRSFARLGTFFSHGIYAISAVTKVVTKFFFFSFVKPHKKHGFEISQWSI